MNFSKINELKPYDLNCNIFDVYSYDGLSMQELLCQFFTKINECIKTSNETIDLASWLVNEGLKQEVALKLTNWLNDGTLENVINETLFENLNKKIDNVSSQMAHIVSGINIDLAWGIEQNINQTEIIQAKINEVSDNTVLNFSGKNYILDEVVLEDKKNIKIVGYNSTIRTDNQFKSIFKMINCENITIEGFNFECVWEKSYEDNQGHVIRCENSEGINIVYNNFNHSGISFLECSNVNITNNKFTDVKQLIYYPILFQNIRGCTVTNNNINGSKIDGIKVSGTVKNGNNSHSIIISHNIIKNCYYDAIDLFSGGYKAIVSNNVLSECEKGVHVKAWGGGEADYSAIEGYAKDVIIEGNHISNTRHQCIWVGCDNVLVDGNILTNSTYGVYVMEGKKGNKVKNVKIVNNIIKDMNYYAVETMDDVENVIIQSNYIENITKFGLRIISSHSTIDNNVFINPGSRGITISSPYDGNRVYVSNNKIISTNTLDFGIIISGSLHNSSSINNNIVDNATVPYQGQIKEGCNSWNNFIILNNKTIAKSIDLNCISAGSITRIELPLKMDIRKMNIDGIVPSSTKSFRGSYTKDIQVCVYVFGDSSFNNSTQSNSICFADNTNNRLFGFIENVNGNSFEIKWSGTGNLTGTAFIKFDIEYC